ncbi:hypothetical protein CHE218_01560 [Microbacterium sp. che218]
MRRPKRPFGRVWMRINAELTDRAIHKAHVEASPVVELRLIAVDTPAIMAATPATEANGPRGRVPPGALQSSEPIDLLACARLPRRGRKSMGDSSVRMAAPTVAS